MKKDKEWAKGQLEYYIKAVGNPFNSRTQSMINAYKNVEHIINQLDEPEKPVIPQFVANWIEKWKREELILRDWARFNLDDENEYEVAEWLYDNDDDEINILRKFTLIDAIRYGYEVEKEKKYRVVFNRKPDDLILFQTTGKHFFIGDESADDGYWKQHFTEAEIKAIDERYWAFAEEVTK